MEEGGRLGTQLSYFLKEVVYFTTSKMLVSSFVAAGSTLTKKETLLVFEEAGHMESLSCIKWTILVTLKYPFKKAALPLFKIVVVVVFGVVPRHTFVPNNMSGFWVFFFPMLSKPSTSPPLW